MARPGGLEPQPVVCPIQVGGPGPPFHHHHHPTPGSAGPRPWHLPHNGTSHCARRGPGASAAEPGCSGRQTFAVNMIYRPNIGVVKSYRSLTSRPSPRLPVCLALSPFPLGCESRALCRIPGPALAPSLGTEMEQSNGIFRQVIMQIWP